MTIQDFFSKNICPIKPSEPCEPVYEKNGCPCELANRSGSYIGSTACDEYVSCPDRNSYTKVSDGKSFEEYDKEMKLYERACKDYETIENEKKLFLPLLKKMFLYPNEQFYESIKNYPQILKYIDQSFNICISAVNINGMALEYVNEKSDIICFAAVNENPGALKFVDNQTLDICIAAVKKDKKSVNYIRNKKMCKLTLQLCKKLKI